MKTILFSFLAFLSITFISCEKQDVAPVYHTGWEYFSQGEKWSLDISSSDTTIIPGGHVSMISDTVYPSGGNMLYDAKDGIDPTGKSIWFKSSLATVKLSYYFPKTQFDGQPKNLDSGIVHPLDCMFTFKGQTYSLSSVQFSHNEFSSEGRLTYWCPETHTCAITFEAHKITPSGVK